MQKIVIFSISWLIVAATSYGGEGQFSLTISDNAAEVCAHQHYRLHQRVTIPVEIDFEEDSSYFNESSDEEYLADHETLENNALTSFIPPEYYDDDIECDCQDLKDRCRTACCTMLCLGGVSFAVRYVLNGISTWSNRINDKTQ